MTQTSVMITCAIPDKKSKYLGNKALLKLNNRSTVIDYHIKSLNKLFYRPKIIIVGGDDSKKLKKYIQDYYDNILYIEHDIDKYTNIGKSISTGLSLINKGNCLIINSSLLLNPTNKIKKQFKASQKYNFVLTSKNNNNDSVDIGYILDNDNIKHTYYGLPNPLFEALYITEKSLLTFKNSINTNTQSHKQYLFEIINSCINNNLIIKPLNINYKDITLINSVIYTKGKYNNV